MQIGARRRCCCLKRRCDKFWYIFLEWKSEWWLQQQGLQKGLPQDLDEGLKAFALGQADLQKCLASHFQEIWHGSLDNSVNNPDNDDDNNGNGDDDEHECKGDLGPEEDEGDD